MSYLLVYLLDPDGPNRYERGMVVDVRDIARPLGSKECPPMFGVIYSEKTVDENLHLLEEKGVWADTATNYPKFSRIGKRARKIDIDSIAAPIPPDATPEEKVRLAKMRVGQLFAEKQKGIIDDLTDVSLGPHVVEL